MNILKELSEILNINQWEKKKGFIITSITIIILYFSIGKFLLPKYFTDVSVDVSLIHFFILLSAISILFIVWFLSTNRIIFRGSSEMCIAVLVNVDDEDKINKRIRYVINNFLSEIKDSFSTKELKIKLLPINYLTSEKSIKNHLGSRHFGLDGIIRLNIESGSYHIEDDKKSIEESMKVSSIDYIGFFGLNNTNNFHKGINIHNDIRLGQFYKDWKYIYTNDGNDKKKYLKNIKETVLNYCGVYAIYLNKNKLALKILKTIFQPENRTFKPKLENGKGKVQLNGNNIIASRQAGILIDLYFITAFQKINNNEKEDAVNLLKECDNLMNHSHPKRYDHCITLARMCFEIGDIEGAKNYTKICSLIRPNSFDVYLNNGWFAIIDNNINDFLYNYKKIKNKGFSNNFNFVDVIEFMERFEEKYESSSLLIEIAKGFLWKLGAVPINGDKILDDVLQKLNSGSESRVKDLIYFINDVRRIKTSTVKKQIINSQKKKKRKRKK